jgi:murein DD-endopeptidase MepM/ murein hydrolase activator NlpD
VPQLVTPPITGGPYVFPVYGVSSYVDTYGVAGIDIDYHHGDDIFGELGRPLLAVADGTVFSVGWNRLGGNRLWLRDHQGNLFYYAHLAAFSISARNGAHVHAGEVIGFMGNTGDAEGALTHLHFEVHPVSLVYLGYDGAVDPTTYLQSWKRIQNLAFPIATGWAPSPPGVVKAPEPGAILLGATDIASAAGLSAAKTKR